MPSNEATEKIKSGIDEWSSYQKEKEGLIDLSYSDLSNFDFEGYTIFNCNLTGTNFSHSNLDRTEFKDNLLKGTIFKNCSLINVDFENEDFSKCNFSYSTIRNSIFNKCKFDNIHSLNSYFESCIFKKCQGNNFEFKETTYKNCSFSNFNFFSINLSNVLLENNNYSNCKQYDLMILDSTLNGNEISDSVYDHLTITNSQINNNSFLRSDLNDIFSSNSVFNENDFSFSNLKRIDLEVLNLSRNVFLKTAFIDCQWPEQKGKVNRFGNYTENKHLLKQPVQDVFGVPPLLRREIADAQYLISFQKKAGKNIFFKLWGLTSDYGQNIVKLSITTLITLVCFTLIGILFQERLFGLGYPDISYFLYEFKKTFFTFFGFSDLESNSGKISINLLNIIARLIGFILLGVWITTASNKFSKLSSN